MAHGFEKGAALSLWEVAFDGLSDEDKRELESVRSAKQIQPSDIIEVVTKKKDECVKKQWILYTNKAGEKVPVRDALSKVVDWIDRFKQCVDVAVQYDPGQAALPWVAVRALLQMAVNDCQTFGSMVESLESISSIIVRYTELETKVLIRTSNLTNQLSASLVKLYGSALRFLAHTSRYYGQGSFKRIIKSTVNSSKSVVEEPMLRIEKYEEEVYKLVCLVQNEITGVRLDDIISSIRQSVENFRISIEEKRKKLAAWINGIDTRNTYETALHYHHDGTCQWALNLPEFNTWKSDKPLVPKLLWIHGPAGFGKTFMSAWIVRHLEREKQAPVSYFFCVADNQLTRDPYAILRSWLTQMLEHDDAIVHATDAFHKARNNEQTLTYLGLWELFVVVGKALDSCTFVIDGFDECIDIDTGARYHRQDPRNLFLRELLKHLQRTNSRVLVVSRDVPDIREYLGKDSSIDSGEIEKLEYSITAQDTKVDVKSFSEYVVSNKLAKKKMELRQKIASQAAERSEGMFLWIKLLEQAISPGQNAKQLTEAVARMPSGISEAYSRELEKINRMQPDEKERAVMILRWTLFAVRPLQVKQLAEALVVSDDSLEEYPDDELPDCWNESFVDEDYVKEMILAPCGSLLQLRSSSPQTPLADRTVHFVHFSVKEYLLNSSGTEDSDWVIGLGLADAASEERRLTTICLRYLTLDTFENIPSDTEIYPFLSYAAWAWYFHSFHQKPAPAKDIIHRTQRAFDPAISSWRVWTPLLEAKLTDSDTGDWGVRDFDASDTDSDTLWENSDSDVSTERGGRDLPQTLATPIYYASLLGLIDVVKWLEDQGLDCNIAGGRFGFPLQAAVVGNHEDMVKHLLNRHIDVSQKGGQYGAAIIAAAAVSTPEIVELLLAAGADIKATDESGLTALHYAADRGNTDIVRQLLNHGADINATTAGSGAAVHFACRSGYKDVVALLASKGADLTVVDNSTDTMPLQIALWNEDVDMAALLLSYGVSPNTLFPNGKRPLHLAIGHLKMIQALLTKGADPNLPDDKDWTPLNQATSSGELESITALIEAGANIRGEPTVNENLEMCSPLQVAIANDHLEAARLLVQNGADVDQKTGGNFTALLAAVENKSLEAVNWLLNAGASIQCIWEHTLQSLFDMAADGDQSEIAQLLVERGCFRIQSRAGTTQEGMSSAASQYENKLAIMAYDGSIESIGSWLVQNRGSITHSILAEALHVASARGHLEVVKLLLRSGVPVNLRDINGRTALHHAAMHLHHGVADVLVESGASISIEDSVGSTPIDLAVTHGAQSLRFTQNHLDNFTLHISRRSSLLAMTPNHAANLTVMGARSAISGAWEGHYEYLSWEKGAKDPFSIDVPAKPPTELRPCTFSNKGEDTVGPFHFHGFVDPAGIVWFVKLYEKLGWLYRGQVQPDKGVFKGTWGLNRKLWFGTFELRQEKN